MECSKKVIHICPWETSNIKQIHKRGARLLETMPIDKAPATKTYLKSSDPPEPIATKFKKCTQQNNKQQHWRSTISTFILDFDFPHSVNLISNTRFLDNNTFTTDFEEKQITKRN